MKSLFAFVRKVKKFCFLTWRDQLLLIEAFALTGVARLIILLVPFHKLASFIGKHMKESPLQVSETAQFTIHKIKWAVTLVSFHTPWKSKCLVQALAAQTMLKRRRIDSTLYLGVARDRENHLIAHAWLRSGEDIITGGFECKWFTVVAQFASDVGGNK